MVKHFLRLRQMADIEDCVLNKVPLMPDHVRLPLNLRHGLI